MEMIDYGIAPSIKSEIGFNRGDQPDYFSSLPDNVITQIFSYLTMTEALAICTSCKKLMHLRTTVPHLEFKESADDSFNLLVDAKKRNLVQVIDRFLKHHDYPIQTFRLFFYPGWYSTDVFNWISHVMNRGLIELDLNFLSNLGKPIELPSSLLNSDTLQTLKLRSCILESPSGFTGLSSLKSLFLGNVTLSDDMIHAILVQSGLLRSLCLENCKGLQSIKVTHANTELEYLSLDNCYSLAYLFAPKTRALSICTGMIKVFVIDVSVIRNLTCLHKSPTQPSRHVTLQRTRQVLDKLKFSADQGVELPMNLEYQGMAKLEFESYSYSFKELCGHTWLLRNASIEKVVLSIIDS